MEILSDTCAGLSFAGAGWFLQKSPTGCAEDVGYHYIEPRGGLHRDELVSCSHFNIVPVTCSGRS